MAAVVEYSQSNQVTSATSLDLAFTGANQATAGNGFVVIISWDTSNTEASPTVSSSKTETETLVIQEANDFGRIGWFKNIDGGNTTLTVSCSVSYFGVTAMEVSGLDETVTPNTNENAVTPTSSTNPSAGAVTTDKAGLTVSGSNFGTSCTWDHDAAGGWTETYDDGAWNAPGGGHVYKIQTGTGSISHTWNTNSTAASWGAVIAHFDDDSAGGGRTTKNTDAWNLGVNVGMGWRMAA